LAAYDYSKSRATADRLILRFGRQITLKAESRTPADALTPWKGSAVSPSNVTPVLLWGVFVPPGAVRIFDLTALGEATKNVDLIAFSEQIIITYPGDVDIKPYKVVNDGTSDLGVTSTQLLRPGSDQVLAFIGVRR
jgi:hypothetical protein